MLKLLPVRLYCKSYHVGDDNLGVPQVGIKITEVTTRGGTFYLIRKLTRKLRFHQGGTPRLSSPTKLNAQHSLTGNNFFTIHFYFLPREAVVPYKVKCTAQPQNSLPLHFSLLLITSKKSPLKGLPSRETFIFSTYANISLKAPYLTVQYIKYL